MASDEREIGNLMVGVVPGQFVKIGENIRVTFVKFKSGRHGYRMLIKAPKNVRIEREPESEPNGNK